MYELIDITTGVLRCAAFSCAANRVLCTDKDDPLYPETSLAHFYDKLLHIKDRLKTELGRELGRERHNLVSTPSTGDSTH